MAGNLERFGDPGLDPAYQTLRDADENLIPLDEDVDGDRGESAADEARPGDVPEEPT